jgi:hypothetical protein
VATSSQRSSARQHYEAAERLIASVQETPQNAPALAVAHSLLASIDPRKLRQRKRPPDLPRHANNGQLPPSVSWGDQ